MRVGRRSTVALPVARVPLLLHALAWRGAIVAPLLAFLAHIMAVIPLGLGSGFGATKPAPNVQTPIRVFLSVFLAAATAVALILVAGDATVRLTVAPVVARLEIFTTVALVAATRSAHALPCGAVARNIVRVAQIRLAVVWRAARPLLLPALSL